MVATTSRWIATVMAVVGMISIAVIYACSRGDRARRPEPPPAGIASSAPAQPGEPPPIPTVSLPCVDDRTELRIGRDGEDHAVPVLCWGDHCIGADRRAVPAPPAPVAESEPTAVVGLEQVCTGARCDPLGPRLRAVLAKADPDDHRSATGDHAAIAIRREGGTVEVWNRASDRRIELGTSPIADDENAEPDTTPESIDVLGNYLLVSWDCHEWCNSEATVIDARGQPTGADPLEIRPARGVSRLGTSIFAAGDDRFLVFGLFGEVSVIAGGDVIARSSLVSPAAGAIEFDAHAIPDGDGNMVALWCHGETCQVNHISIRLERGRGWQLELEDYLALPRCPGAGDRN
jgi:hypothetical protein